MKITILFHLWYYDSVKEIIPLLKSFPGKDVQYIFNVPEQENNLHINIASEIKKEIQNSIVICTSNIGKDIGGKLAMLNFFLQQDEKSDFLIFLHDKKSELVYSINDKKVDAAIWRKELFSIVFPDNYSPILNMFENKEVGIITHKKHINTIEEHGDWVIYGNNKDKMNELCNKFSIQPDSLSFVGGTMFWVRTELYRNFFKKYSPLQIRSILEKGSFTDRYSGTYTHSMERIFSWIVTSQGYKIGGMEDGD